MAITNVNVVPMDRPGVLARQTVLIEDGRIATLAPSDGERTGGAEIIDGNGKYLTPGLADMHVHLWDSTDIALYLANGVTTVRNMLGTPFHLELRRQVDARQIPGPRILTSGPVIDGPDSEGAPFWPGTILFVNPGEAAGLVERIAGEGYDQIKIYHQLSADCLRALGEASSNCGIRMVGHCPEAMTYEQAIDAGLTCFEHLRGVGFGRLKDGGLLPKVTKSQGRVTGLLEVLRATSENLEMPGVERLAGIMAARQIWNCPTLAIQTRVMNDREVSRSRLLRYQRPGQVDRWRQLNGHLFDDAPDETINAVSAKYRTRLVEVVGALHQEGAPLLLGTDTPNPFVFQGESIHDELSSFIEAGLSAYEAIAAGTVEAARFMGAQGRWGTVTAGAQADLLLTARNPLEDISALKTPEAVFVNGFVLHEKDLKDLLDARAELVKQANGIVSA